MKDNKTNNRRKVLLGLTGGIAGASQLPGKWTKPVVDSVILPSHAQTSSTTPVPVPPTTTTVAPLAVNFRGNVGIGLADSGFDKIISAFISQAHAGGFPRTGDCCVNSPDAINFTLSLLIASGQGFTGFYEASGTVGSMPMSVNDTNGCFPSINLAVNSITAAGALVDILGISTTIPEGMGCPTNTGSMCDSDIRLKTDVKLLNKKVNDLKLYQFKYLSDAQQTDYVGVMAQDIINTHPHAVTKRSDGFYAVYYNQLGLQMTTLEDWEKNGIEAVKANLQ